MADSFSISVILGLRDRFTAPIRRVTRALRGLNGPIEEVTANLDILNQTFNEAGRRITTVGKKLSTGLTLPIVGLGAVSAKTAIEFESAFTGIEKTVEATAPQLKALRAGFIDMAKSVPLATTELFGIGEAAGQLGIKQEDILEFSKVMADLGATTNLGAAEAATSLAKFANITKLSEKDYDKLGSTIVALGNNLATTEKDIVAMGLRLAGAGATIGLTQAQILSFAGALSSVGIQAELGGSAFSQVMKKISKEIGSGSKKMRDFALVAGEPVAVFEKAWKEDASKALLTFVDGLAKVQKQGANVNTVLDDLGFEGIRISDTLLRAAGASGKFAEAITIGNDAWKENNALQKEANLRYKTTASRLIIAKNRLAILAASFGDVFLPIINKVIDRLAPFVEWLGKLDPATKEVISIVALLVAGLGPLIIALGAISFALAALATPIGLVIAKIALVVAGVATLIAIFEDGVSATEAWIAILVIAVAALTLPISAVTAAFIAAGIAISAVITAIIENWDKITDGVFASIEAIKTGFKTLASFLPDFVTKGLGLSTTIDNRTLTSPKEFGAPAPRGSGLPLSLGSLPPVETSNGMALARTANTGAIANGKSETDITVRLIADPGTQATVERVNPILGDANVVVASLGYVGIGL